MKFKTAWIVYKLEILKKCTYLYEGKSLLSLRTATSADNSRGMNFLLELKKTCSNGLISGSPIRTSLLSDPLAYHES